MAGSRRSPALPGTAALAGDASEKTHRAAALAIYAEQVDALVNLGGNPGYQHAAELIARMASLRDASEQADYVASIKSRFARKRNFMKMLE